MTSCLLVNLSITARGHYKTSARVVGKLASRQLKEGL